LIIAFVWCCFVQAALASVETILLLTNLAGFSSFFVLPSKTARLLFADRICVVGDLETMTEMETAEARNYSTLVNRGRSLWGRV